MARASTSRHGNLQLNPVSNLGESCESCDVSDSISPTFSRSALQVGIETFSHHDTSGSGSLQNNFPEQPHDLSKGKINQLVSGSVPRFRNRGLKFAHLNIHSLVAKIDELRLLLRNASFDVIGLNETFCDSMIDDSELHIDDYVLLRRDRTRHGGGVAVYISKRFNYKRRDDLTSSNLECIWFELHYPNKSPILVGEFYRPPNSHVDFFEELDRILDSALSEDMSCIIFGHSVQL